MSISRNGVITAFSPRSWRSTSASRTVVSLGVPPKAAALYSPLNASETTSAAPRVMPCTFQAIGLVCLSARSTFGLMSQFAQRRSSPNQVTNRLTAFTFSMVSWRLSIETAKSVPP